MMFTACWTTYMCRLQMAILAVPMIRTVADGKQISGACVDQTEANRSKRWLAFDPYDDPLSQIYGFESDFQNSAHSILPRATNETMDQLPETRKLYL